jgi:hypothetical protein
LRLNINNNGIVIFHLGPPKTATTSLQIALKNLKIPNLFFAGKYHPDSDESMSYKFYKICSDKDYRLKCDISAIIREIKKKLGEGKIVFISEEMFLLYEDKASIIDKLKVLKKILNEIPIRILLTIRDPKDALISLYQTIYQGLPYDLQINFSKFCNNKRAACFDYENLLKTIYENGFKDINIINYDKLISDKIDLSQITEIKEHKGISLNLKKYNQTLRDLRSQRIFPNPSLRNIGMLSWVKRIIGLIGLKSWPGYHFFLRLLDNIKYTSKPYKFKFASTIDQTL